MSRRISIVVVLALGCAPIATAEDAGQQQVLIDRTAALADVADVPAQDLHAGGDEDKRYFLIGGGDGAETPSEGYRLLIVLPGGDGGPDFHPFVRRIYKQALSKNYLVAQLVAKTWSADQFDRVVWPTTSSPLEGMKFSTEEFVTAVVQDVKRAYKIDERCVFVLAWSSGGPAAYAVSLHENTPITGSFVAMSVFKPKELSSLERASGHAYYILHSPEDIIPIRMAEEACDALGEHGATVRTYSGGHGWHGDVYGMIRTGIQWLEEQAR